MTTFVTRKTTRDALVTLFTATSDWQDAFPHKYGHTINSISLYYALLRLYGMAKELKNVTKAVSGQTSSKIQMFNSKKGYFFPSNIL